MKPKNILELGTSHGVSAIMMYSELAPDGRLVSVDINPEKRYVPPEMFSDERVEFVTGDCLDLNIYETMPHNVDFLFTDTVHYYQQVRDEYDIYHPLLNDGAFIIIDDVNCADKRKLFDELPFEKWDLTEWCHFNGFGLIRYHRKGNPTVMDSILASARVGFRKYHAAQTDLDNRFLRKYYWKTVNALDIKHPFFTAVRRVLRPLKLLYTPKDKTY